MSSTTIQAEVASHPDEPGTSVTENEGETNSAMEGNDLSQGKSSQGQFSSIELSNPQPASSLPTVTVPREVPSPTTSSTSYYPPSTVAPPQQQFHQVPTSTAPTYSNPNVRPTHYPPQQFHSPSQPFQSPLQRPSTPSTSSNVLPTAPGGVQIGRNGNNFNFKQWSTTTYRYAKQIINERIGRGTRTFDAQLEGQIQGLRDTQFKYTSLLRLIKQYIIQFRAVLITQASMGDTFADLAIRSVDLESEFTSNAKTQKAILENGETMMAAMNFVVSSLTTLCDKTMADTLETVKVYENARIEYDAIRNEVESYPETNQSPRAIALRHEFGSAKEKFEKLRNDVSVKLKFLEENKAKVMHKQLVLFHDAFCAYFSGNQEALQTIVRDFHLKLTTQKSTKKPSFLESS